MQRFITNWQNLLALLIIGAFVSMAIAAPLLAPPEDPQNPSPFRTMSGYRPTAQEMRIPQPPNADYPLGTTVGGFDVRYTLIWGTRYALRFGLIVALSTATLGVLLGAISGYFGGVFNRLILRVTDAFLTFPAIAGIWLFSQVIYPPDPQAVPTALQSLLAYFDIDAVMLALITFSWMPYARIINAEVTRLKHEEYALAARSVGVDHLRLIFRHLLPNAIAPAIVLTARDVGAMVVLQAAFTYIGVAFGSAWGALLASGRNWIIGPGGSLTAYWWIYLPITVTVVLFGVGWNLLGDGLNAVLNPWNGRR